MEPETVDMTAEIWTILEVARFFRMDPKTVQQRIICRPGFPKGFRPTGATRGERRWWRDEIREWAKEAA